jgi:hypothetical protein
MKEPLESDISGEGRLLHDLIADPSKSRTHLTSEQQVLVERAEENEAEFIHRMGLSHQFVHWKEGRLYLKDSDGNPIYDDDGEAITGQPDSVRLFLMPVPAILVTDYKFGFLPVEPAEANMQLRSYMTMVAQANPEVGTFYGLIDQPRCYPQVHAVVYTPQDIDYAKAELIQIWEQSHDPKSRPSLSEEGCRYCRARLICPLMKNLPAKINRTLYQRDPKTVLAAMSPAKRTALIEMVKLVGPYLEDVKSAAKDLLREKPDAIPGYYLADTPSMRPINNPTEAWIRAEKLGVRLPEFMEAVGINKEAMEGALKHAERRKACGSEDPEVIKKVKVKVKGHFDEIWASFLSGITSEIPKAPHLAKSE